MAARQPGAAAAANHRARNYRAGPLGKQICWAGPYPAKPTLTGPGFPNPNLVAPGPSEIGPTGLWNMLGGEAAGMLGGEAAGISALCPELRCEISLTDAADETCDGRLHPCCEFPLMLRLGCSTLRLGIVEIW